MINKRKKELRKNEKKKEGMRRNEEMKRIYLFKR